MATDLDTYLRRVLPKLRPMAPPGDHPELSEACQIWTGARRGYHGDYGAIWFEGKSRRVHRVVWRLLNGRWPGELDHICERTLCCELSHLREVSAEENAARREGNVETVIDTNEEVPF